MRKESFKEHPAYKDEDLEVKTPEELEEAKEELEKTKEEDLEITTKKELKEAKKAAGVTSGEKALTRAYNYATEKKDKILIENIKREDKQRIMGKVKEGVKNISSKEIEALNSEIPTSTTEFTERTLECLKEMLKSEDFKDFNEAISKYPVVDLACGHPDIVLKFLFKEKWHGFLPSFYDEKDFNKAGIVEPPKYIGVDKYQENFVADQDKKLVDRIQFEKKDIIEFLKTLPDNSVNIFIGGFDWSISRPEKGEDNYRAMMVAEIARVLAKGGYCLISNSLVYGEWDGCYITLEDFGLKVISKNRSRASEVIGYGVGLFKKPEEEK
jgi:hypothetical protein